MLLLLVGLLLLLLLLLELLQFPEQLLWRLRLILVLLLLVLIGRLLRERHSRLLRSYLHLSRANRLRRLLLLRRLHRGLLDHRGWFLLIPVRGFVIALFVRVVRVVSLRDWRLIRTDCSRSSRCSCALTCHQHDLPDRSRLVIRPEQDVVVS